VASLIAFFFAATAASCCSFGAKMMGILLGATPSRFLCFLGEERGAAGAESFFPIKF